MFDNFDLYETCEEYYNEKHVDYYQYYLMNEERLEEEKDE